VQAEAERGHDPEIRAGAADRPEEVLVLLAAGSPHATVGDDDLDLEQVIDGPSEATGEVSETTAEGEARHANLRDETERCGEAVQLRFTIDIAEQAPGSDRHRACLGIDEHAAQGGHVERQPAVGQGGPRDVVTTATHRQQQSPFAREVDPRDDIDGAGRPHHEARRLLDHAVPQARCLFEPNGLRRQDFSPHL
jgi:hypothetical protein